MMNKLFVLILCLLIVSPLVSAVLVTNKYTNDFTLSSPNNEQLKACSCETKTDTIVVDNVGNFPANFRVEILSPVNGWMTLSETEFLLEAKHKNLFRDLAFLKNLFFLPSLKKIMW